jgi:hypothetical protein
MGYFRKIIPNFSLGIRILSEVSPGRVYFQARNHLRYDLIQPDHETDRFIAPNSIFAEASYRCSRRCDGCYVLAGDGARMSEEIANECHDAAGKIGVNYVIWVGGEPMLPSTSGLVFEMLEEHPNVSSVICTNGDFVDDRLADRAARYNNVSFTLSIDGLREKNDRRRGEGSFDNVTNAMRLLGERKIVLGYSATITSDNHEEVAGREFVEEMIQMGNILGSYTLFFAEEPHPLQPSPEQYARSMDKLNSLAGSVPIYLFSSQYGRLTGERLQKGKKLLSVTVDPYGNVSTERGGCPVDQITDGNSLSDIIRSDTVQEIFRKKLSGADDAPPDGGRRLIEEQAVSVLV